MKVAFVGVETVKVEKVDFWDGYGDTSTLIIMTQDELVEVMGYAMAKAARKKINASVDVTVWKDRARDFLTKFKKEW